MGGPSPAGAKPEAGVSLIEDIRDREFPYAGRK